MLGMVYRELHEHSLESLDVRKMSEILERVCKDRYVKVFVIRHGDVEYLRVNIYELFDEQEAFEKHRICLKAVTYHPLSVSKDKFVASLVKASHDNYLKVKFATVFKSKRISVHEYTDGEELL